MTDPYAVLVTGPRDCTDTVAVEFQLMLTYSEAKRQGRRLLVRHGHHPGGADQIADQWAVSMKNRGMPVDYERHPAIGHPTEDFGPWPGAGPRRNNFMISLPTDLCLAFIHPCTRSWCTRPRPHDSHGTAGCARGAEARGIETRRIPV